MSPCFADASYYIALLSQEDDAHERTVAVTESLDRHVVSTVWVLAELGGRLASPPDRQAFVDLVAQLLRDPDVTIVPAEQRLFDAGLELYARRPDKQWSLIDCISFVVMSERGLSEALSTDHHFEQAGFRILIK